MPIPELKKKTDVYFSDDPRHPNDHSIIFINENFNFVVLSLLDYSLWLSQDNVFGMKMILNYGIYY